MDKKYIEAKLKKYLFFISIVFLTLSSVHLIYNYIYDDSKEVAQKWWTISESFLWAFPNLNPLKYNNDYNSYINHILYRSLLTYDVSWKKIVWDLATCDIEDIAKIECFLTDNIKWSSWDSITSDDIISTYNIIKETDINPVLKNTLENVTITKSESSILFESTTSDVNILNIFFQGIMPKSVIEEIEIDKLDWNFSPINWIYSWKYQISNVDQDETIWFTKIFLEKNNFYTQNPIYIDNIILKFYEDYPNLSKQKESINIFNDKKQLIWESIPKLENHKYILPQYVSVFINKDKLEYPNIRNYILSNINSDEILKKLWTETNKKIDSPFLNELKLDTFSNNTSLEPMLNSLWYYNKDYYLKKIWTEIQEKNINNYSSEIKIEKEKIISTTWSIEENIKDEELLVNITEITNSITKENFNSKSKIIKGPTWVDKYNFITNPNITLEWITSTNVSEVYINDFKLENYDSNNETFSYKLSESLWNIKSWENNYKIYFTENGKKSLKETITFIYDKNKSNLEKSEADLISRLTNEKIELAKKEALDKKNKQKELELKLELEKKEVVNTNIILTPEQIRRQNLIRALDDRFYYNSEFNPYSLKLSFINWSKQINIAVQEIQSQLENSWIKIELKDIKLTDLTNQIKENTEDYNILVAWINLWYFDFNLSKYFYSGQINKWKNFSKIKNSALDNILEDLKSSLLNKAKILELEQSVIKILKAEAIFKPLYSPYYSNLILKNIEWYDLPEVIPSDIYRFDPLSKSYILKEKIINKSDKTISGYIKYLFTNLF